MRWYHEFYLDYERFDKQNDLQKIFENIAISTWLNKKNIVKLALEIINNLILKLEKATDIEIVVFASNNQDDLMCLMWIFNFHRTITWIPTSEKWWLNDLKWKIWDLINTSKLSRKKIWLLNWLLTQSNYEYSSLLMISRIKSIEENMQNNEKSDGKNLVNFNYSNLKNFDKLAMYQASIISWYLEKLKKIKETSEESSWKIILCLEQKK